VSCLVCRQVYQWIRHGAKANGMTPITGPLVKRILDDEAGKLLAEVLTRGGYQRVLYVQCLSRRLCYSSVEGGKYLVSFPDKKGSQSSRHATRRA
jgi:hypothetical protein